MASGSECADGERSRAAPRATVRHHGRLHHPAHESGRATARSRPGAIEAAASTGGMILPPLRARAFVWPRSSGSPTRPCDRPAIFPRSSTCSGCPLPQVHMSARSTACAGALRPRRIRARPRLNRAVGLTGALPGSVRDDLLPHPSRADSRRVLTPRSWSIGQRRSSGRLLNGTLWPPSGAVDLTLWRLRAGGCGKMPIAAGLRGCPGDFSGSPDADGRRIPGLFRTS